MQVSLITATPYIDIILLSMKIFLETNICYYNIIIYIV